MITPQLNIAESLSLPTGTGVTLPQAATPDFAALFASVAVAPSDEGSEPTVAIEFVMSEPVVLSFPTGTESVMPVALPALAQFSIMPAISVALGTQTPAAVMSIVEEDSSTTSVEPFPADAGTTATTTSEPVTVSPTFVSATILPSGPPVTLAEPQRNVASKALDPDAAVVAIATSVVVEPAKRTTSAVVERIELSIAPLSEIRLAAVVTVPDKHFAPMPNRAATFAPIIADAVRDLVAIAHDKDVRFNVRPETLGPVAITIERTEAGQTLRLSVETQAAVQAVRQAEPMMNDARGSAPFVQITVDMNAPDSRGRSPRMRPFQGAAQDRIFDVSQQPVSTGRYA